MNVGLDIHGVIDADPEFFLKFANDITSDGGKVFIITGHPINEDLIHELEVLGFHKKMYYKILSIQDHLDAFNVHVEGLDKYGRNHYDDHEWDVCKAYFCDNYDIDVHIDDTFRYFKHFKENIIFGLYHDGGIEYLV